MSKTDPSPSSVNKSVVAPRGRRPSATVRVLKNFRLPEAQCDALKKAGRKHKEPEVRIVERALGVELVRLSVEDRKNVRS